MASAARAKIIFLTVVGGFILPLILSLIGNILDFIIGKFSYRNYSLMILSNNLYFFIVGLWENIFTKESFPPPFETRGGHSYIVMTATDLTYYFIFALISYLLAKKFVKDKKEEYLSIS